MITDNGANILKAGRLLQDDGDTNPADDSSSSDDEDQDDQSPGLGASPTIEKEPDEEEQYLHRDKEIEQEMSSLGKKRGRCFRYDFCFLTELPETRIIVNKR